MTQAPPFDERLLSHELDDAQREQLLRTMATSPEARAEWAQCLVEDVLFLRLARPPLNAFAPARRPRRMPLLAVAAVLLLGLGLGVLVALRGSGDTPPATAPTPPPLVRALGPARFAGSVDGSDWRFLGQNLPQRTAAGVWQLERGGILQMDVQPRHRREAVRIDTPRTRFDIVGTRFIIRHHPYATTLAVFDGRVTAHPHGKPTVTTAAGSWWQIDDQGHTTIGPLLDDHPSALYDFRYADGDTYLNTGPLGPDGDLLAIELANPSRSVAGLAIHGVGYLATRKPLPFALTGGEGIRTVTMWMRTHDRDAAPRYEERLFALHPRRPEIDESPRIWTLSSQTLDAAGIGSRELVHIALCLRSGQPALLLNGELVGYAPSGGDSTTQPQHLLIAGSKLPDTIEPPRWIRLALYNRVLSDAEIQAQIATGPDGLVTWTH